VIETKIFLCVLYCNHQVHREFLITLYYEECGLLVCDAVQFGRCVPKCTASHCRGRLMLVSVDNETKKQVQKGHDKRPRFVVPYRRFRTDRMSGNVGKEPLTRAV
jgi:hypothetical protein